jgi:hypothetical protein
VTVLLTLPPIEILVDNGGRRKITTNTNSIYNDGSLKPTASVMYWGNLIKKSVSRDVSLPVVYSHELIVLFLFFIKCWWKKFSDVEKNCFCTAGWHCKFRPPSSSASRRIYGTGWMLRPSRKQFFAPKGMCPPDVHHYVHQDACNLSNLEHRTSHDGLQLLATWSSDHLWATSSHSGTFCWIFENVGLHNSPEADQWSSKHLTLVR